MPFFDIFASPRRSPLRMRTKVVSFFLFFQELSNKKIKALRPKMTKIASSWGGGGGVPALSVPQCSYSAYGINWILVYLVPCLSKDNVLQWALHHPLGHTGSCHWWDLYNVRRADNNPQTYQGEMCHRIRRYAFKACGVVIPKLFAKKLCFESVVPCQWP